MQLIETKDNSQTKYGIEVTQAQIDICKAWMEKHCRIRSHYSLNTSYQMKHLVENWARRTLKIETYIPHGAVVEAAKALGYKARAVEGLKHSVSQFNFFVLKDAYRPSERENG